MFRRVSAASSLDLLMSSLPRNFGRWTCSRFRVSSTSKTDYYRTSQERCGCSRSSPAWGREMKTSRTEAAEARQRIVRAAADRFRRDGIAETGLAGFMPEAGLTAGGFYAFFYFQERLRARGTGTPV